MSERALYVSHHSALYYWRTNPPWYVLEGADRNIRSLQFAATRAQAYREFDVPEIEFGSVPIDVLVPSDRLRPSRQFRYHVSTTRLPPHALYPVRDGIHVVSPELCLVQMCSRLSVVKALQLGMELCGTYALRPDQLEDMAPRDYRLVDAASFQRHVARWKGFHGLTCARRVARYLVNDSASPMETIVYLLLCLPPMLGGYKLPRPELNAQIDLDERDCRLLRKDYVKPDFRWRLLHLILEFEGEYHNDEAQRISDEKRRVVLESMGYTVISLKKQQVYDPLAFDSVARMLARKLGKRLAAETPERMLAREQLREELLHAPEPA